ncbi:MAG: PA0069 family radical SAM protein [Sandaracinaceae bacterium]|nr:PA0069 family radical SAM protein [Sandaracinaceae bacterium]
MPRPISNPPSPFLERFTVYDVDGEPVPPAHLEVYEERSKSILSRNESPDIAFRWSLNPYRGCYHGCIYCYARPSHGYWGFGAGTDFERKIIVKTNAPELLEEMLSKPSWKGEWITLSGNTDCYQPLEAKYRLTRRIIEVCLRFKQAIAIITKSALVCRDIDLLSDLAKCTEVRVVLSVPMPDDALGRKIEPYASLVSKRFEAMRRLADAQIPVGVSLAPIIPGLNDHAIPSILDRAKASGARFAFMSLVRLPHELRLVFEERLKEVLPERAQTIIKHIRAVRGMAKESAFGERMRGEGERWELIERLFHLHAKRLGLEIGINAMAPPLPSKSSPQLALFDED